MCGRNFLDCTNIHSLTARVYLRGVWCGQSTRWFYLRWFCFCAVHMLFLRWFWFEVIWGDFSFSCPRGVHEVILFEVILYLCCPHLCLWFWGDFVLVLSILFEVILLWSCTLPRVRIVTHFFVILKYMVVKKYLKTQFEVMSKNTSKLSLRWYVSTRWFWFAQLRWCCVHTVFWGDFESEVI